MGYAPDAVDFSDPALSPGSAKVADGIKRDVELMQERGWQAEHLPIPADASPRDQILAKLSGASYDYVVAGAGVRMTTTHVPEFEQVIAGVRERARNTPIVFNTGPGKSVEAVERWLKT